MANDITSAINYVQDLWLEISGIKAAPDTPPEVLNQFPFAVTFEQSGSAKIDKNFNSTTWAEQSGVIVSELHLTRQSLPSAVAAAMAYRNLFLNKLRTNPNLNATVMAIESLSWQFGALEYGETPTIGYKFSIGVMLELTA